MTLPVSVNSTRRSFDAIVTRLAESPTTLSEHELLQPTHWALGEDELNGLAGRRVDVNAQMAAAELSYDRDWLRFKLSGFWAR